MVRRVLHTATSSSVLSHGLRRIHEIIETRGLPSPPLLRADSNPDFRTYALITLFRDFQNPVLNGIWTLYGVP